MPNIVPMNKTGALTRRDPARLALFKRTVGKHLQPAEIDAAIEMCEVYGANPFVKDIIFMIMHADDHEKRTVVPVLTIQQYRKVAKRTGDYRPDDRPARFTYDENLIGSPANPKGIVDCEVTVYMHAHGAWHPITERLRWDERAPIILSGDGRWEDDPSGAVNPPGHKHAGKPKRKFVRSGDAVPILDPKKTNWHGMPQTMLAKCFSEDTEILTTNGFRRFADVRDAPIMQVTDHGLEPVVAKPFFQAYDGDMVACHGDKNLNFMVTPNHDMVTTQGKMEAGALYEVARSRPMYFIPRICAGREIDVPVSDTAIRIAAAVLCDGWFSSMSTASIGVSRDYKIERLRSYGVAKGERMMRAAGATATLKTGRVITTARDKTVFAFDITSMEGLIVDDKKTADLDLFTQLSARQAAIFVEEMIFYDGSIQADTGVRRFTQKAGPIADLFELVACSGGFCVSTVDRGDARIMTLSDRNAVAVLRWNRPYKGRNGEGKQRTGLQIEKNPGNGVWCVTVPSGRIIVRRNSFSMVCGNCVEGAVIRKAWPNETAGTYVEGEMDRHDVIDLSASEIIDNTEREDRMARIGGPGIMVDWMDKEPLQRVPVGQFHDKVQAFIDKHMKAGEEEAGLVLAWRDRNRHSLGEFWALEKDAALQIKKRLEAVAEFHAKSS